MSIEARLKELDIALPKKDLGKGLVSCKQVGDMVYVSGHGPNEADGKLLLKGAVGRDLTVEQGYEAARKTGINMLASLKAFLGSLDRIDEVVKVMAWVNCPDGFTDTPAVVHGFSDLMVEVFGEKGKHARSAIGTNALPGNMCVEVECIFKLR